MEPIENIKVGDRITFKAATRSHYAKATRIVTGIRYTGEPQVRYHGYGDFIVRWHEVIEHHPQ